MHPLENMHAALRESTKSLPIPELAIAAGHITTAATIISSVAEGTDRLDGALTDVLESGSHAETASLLFRMADERLLDYMMKTGGELCPIDGPTFERPSQYSADELRKQHEDRVLHRVVDAFRGLPTLKNLMAPGFDLDPRELIRNKVVCDMGSGWGGLAKSASAEKIGTTVHCVNPRLRNPALKTREELKGREELRLLYPKLTEKDIDRIQRVHDKYLRTEFAHDISLPDQSVDVIIDSIAVHSYMSHDPNLYRQTIAQYARILRPDGLVIVLDAGHGYRRSAAEIKFRQKAAYEAGLRYRPVTNVLYDMLHGAIMWKR